MAKILIIFIMGLVVVSYPMKGEVTTPARYSFGHNNLKLVTMKECVKCGIEKENKQFSPSIRNKDGLFSYCNECHKENVKSYHRTKKGLITSIINSQRQNSKTRGHKKPNYNIDELRNWAYSQEIYHTLYDLWVLSGYSKWERPSFDRIDSNKHYTLDNIQIVTWRQNSCFNYIDISAGTRKNKGLLHGGHKKVIAIDRKTGEELIFISISKAARELNISPGNISSVCQGKRNIASGYKFKYVI